MKVLIVTQYYPPEEIHIPASIARGLFESGHQVRVVTGYPNYPDGELYPGYHQRWRKLEYEGGIEVLRVPLWIDHSQSASKRILNYASFALSAATARGFAQGADVVYVYATQMTPTLGPWLWRLTGGAPYVLHVQDLWPDSITGSSLVGNGLVGKMIELLLNPYLRSVYRRAAAVIGIAPTMVETLISRGAAPCRTHLAYNWAFESAANEPAGMSDRDERGSEVTRIIYGGNVGDMQDLETAVEAVHAARDTGVSLLIVGGGVALPKVRDIARRLGSTNVEFMGRVPRGHMTKLYAQADFALVTLKDLPAFRGTIPSKLQASLAHGLPVITTVQGDVRAIVDGLGIGYTADSQNVASLEAALRQAAATPRRKRREMAHSAWEAYARQFSKESGVSRLESILLNVSALVPARKANARNIR